MIFIYHLTFASWGLVVSIGEHFIKNPTALSDYSLLWAASFGVINFTLSLYTTIGVFGVYFGKRYTKSWHWFIVQSVLRTLVSLQCIFIFLIVFKASNDV